MGKPPLSKSLWVAMETMHFYIAHTIFRTASFRIQGVPMNNLAPMNIFFCGGGGGGGLCKENLN